MAAHVSTVTRDDIPHTRTAIRIGTVEGCAVATDGSRSIANPTRIRAAWAVDERRLIGVTIDWGPNTAGSGLTIGADRAHTLPDWAAEFVRAEQPY